MTPGLLLLLQGDFYGCGVIFKLAWMVSGPRAWAQARARAWDRAQARAGTPAWAQAWTRARA